MPNRYDLIIVGSGPAGLTAALYAARYQVNMLVIGDPFSSSVCSAHLLENWPGEEKISGVELISKMVSQVKNHQVKIINENIIKIENQDGFKLTTDAGEEFFSQAVIMASGTQRKKLNIIGEKELLGRGVSYCATCDAPFFKEKIVAVVGGGNSALMAANLLSSYAKKVYLIQRGQECNAELVWQEKVKNNKKIEILFNRSVLEIKGQNKVEEIILDKEFEANKSLKVDGLFIEIGSQAVTEILKEIGVDLDTDGSIKINSDGSSNLKGLFAAGDITNGLNKFRQVITAAAGGAIAALGVYNYLKTKK